MAKFSLKPSSKGVLALIIVAAVLLIGCVLEYVAIAEKMKTTTADLEARRAKVAESTQIAQKLEKSKLAFVDIQSQILYLETSVSKETYVPTLLKQLEQTAKSVKLKVISVQPSQEETKPEPRSIKSGAEAASGDVEKASTPVNGSAPVAAKEPVLPYSQLDIAIELNGSYTNVLDFLYKITSFPKILAVKNVSISPADKTESYTKSPSLAVKMTVTAFILKKETPLAKPDNSSATNSRQTSAGERRAGNEAG